LSREVFDEVRRTAPDGICYAVFRNGDEVTHLFLNLREDSSDAVTALASFDRYQQDILERCVEPPQPTRLSVELVDSYGLRR